MADTETNPDVNAGTRIVVASVPASEATKTLNAIIDALTPLGSDVRHRTVNAAMTFLGENPKNFVEYSAPARTIASSGGDDARDGTFSAAVSKWMQQNGVSSQMLEEVFHLTDSEYDIHGVPGASKRAETQNAYILTGLGTFLTTGEKIFTDAKAREFCEKLGCYDQANHSKYVKESGNVFSGDKVKGYTLTVPGLRRAADIVKEQAGTARD